MTLVHALKLVWLDTIIKCRKSVGNSSKLVLLKAVRSAWNKGTKSSRLKKAICYFVSKVHIRNARKVSSFESL
jgi:hypothetical protein